MAEDDSTAAADLVKREDKEREEKLPVVRVDELPPILQGMATPDVKRRVERFYASVGEMFERWIARSRSRHTQRAYRQDIVSFALFLGPTWGVRLTTWLVDGDLEVDSAEEAAEARKLGKTVVVSLRRSESWRFLTVTVEDVQNWRDFLAEDDAAPKTLNRRVSSLSGFYRYVSAAAAVLKLPIIVANPAHAQFIARESSDPVKERQHLSATKARQLMGLPEGESVLAYRDRAILRVMLYTGIRLGTLCRLNVGDFHEDDGEATLKLEEKGNKHRTIGIHVAAAEATREYIKKAELTRGPLFRPRLNSRSEKLARTGFSSVAMYSLLLRYLERLPGAVVEVDTDGDLAAQDDESTTRCIYTPHSLRTTTATLLLEAGVDIMKVKDLLGHRHVTTTQIYDKRRLAIRDSASHEVPI